MIDLRSDTVTKPTDDMRKAMARAEVGDDVYGEDPTVNRLQDMAATMLGKRFALFIPSGTMANQLAIRSHTQPGQEIIVESKSHVVRYEQGAAGALAGVQLHWVTGERGIMTAEQVEAASPAERYAQHYDGLDLHREHAQCTEAARFIRSPRSKKPMPSPSDTEFPCTSTGPGFSMPWPPPPCLRRYTPNTSKPSRSVSRRGWELLLDRC